MSKDQMIKSAFLSERIFKNFLFSDGNPFNFVIAGSGNYFTPLRELLEVCIGRFPVIVLHNGNYRLEQIFGEICVNSGTPFMKECSRNRLFEPFLGMQPEEIVAVFDELANTAGEQIPANFDQAIRALLQIVAYMQCEEKRPVYSLTALYQLVINEREKLVNGIYGLHCPKETSIRMISDLGLNHSDGSDTFDLICRLIRRLAFEASRSSWSYREERGSISITTAVQSNVPFCMSVDDMNIPLLRSFLGSELRLLSRSKFLLILDSIRLTDPSIADALSCAQGFRFGIVCSNLAGITGNDESTLVNIGENIHRWIFLKHRTWLAAEAASKLVGTALIEQVSETEKQSRFWLEPPEKSKTYSNDTQYRLRPEFLQQLSSSEAILFDALNNTFVRI